MRFLLATDTIYPAVNGVAQYISTLLTYSSLSGDDLLLISQNAFWTFRCPGYREVELAIPSQSKVIRHIERVKPDLVHIVTEGPVGLAVRMACVRLGLPYSTSYLTNFEGYAACRLKCSVPLVRRYLRWFHSGSSVVAAPSRSAQEYLEAIGFTNAVILPLGVDLELFSPDRRNRRALSGLSKPLFLYVGRLAIEKSVQVFLSLRLPGTKLVVGDGPTRVSLSKMFNEAVFLGCRFGVELAEIYACSDVLVFPSKTDTFGIVQVEALASGLPVAAHRGPGPSDVIGSSDAGVLDDKLEVAALNALGIARDRCRAHGEQFPGHVSGRLFFEHLKKTRGRFVDGQR